MIAISYLVGLPNAADTLLHPSPPVADSSVDTLQATADSVSPRSLQTDSTAADSVEAAALRDSLLAVQRHFTDIYYRFPTTVDSTHNPYRLFPFHLRQADVAGISELLRFSPLFVTIPYSLSSSLNRSLYLGYPTPRTYLLEPYDAGVPPATPVVGTDRRFVTDVQQIRLEPGNYLLFEPRSLPTVAPFTSIYWENGVFDENTLRVLFARPIARHLSVGISSNYRYFRGMEYSHRNGNVYGGYRNAVKDTSLIVNRGTNPPTSEHEVSVSAAWHDRIKAHARYSYLDMHNGKSIIPDSSGVRWDTLHQYAHDVTVGLDSARVGGIGLQAKLLLRNETYREHRILDSRGAYVQRRGGEQLTVGGALRGAIGLSDRDTLRIDLDSRYIHKGFYHPREWDLSHSTMTGGYARWFGGERTRADISLDFGYALETVNGEAGHGPIWHAHATGTHAGQRLDLFARRDALPYNPPFDPAFTYPLSVPDFVDMYGASLYLHRNKLGLLTSYTYSTGVDSASLLHAWPEGQYPYPEPHSVLVVSPILGRFFGFSLYTRHILSDVRPFHKFQAGLSYELHAANDNEHIRFDVVFDYWSERDPISYAGIDTWHRSIADLYAEGSVQIKSFRFFYKVDNILNRKIAYAPGYFMPGLTFRWGFNWYFRR
ncbi:MAG: hypothetical protein GF331_11110 [Chitinivibrionales bacterium]|nr:hypothetical protein [Chitinivibrionales bacterium]